MTPQQFVQNARLEFFDATPERADIPPLWVGGDNFEEVRYEIQVHAGQSGPTQTQVDCYTRYYDAWIDILVKIEPAIRNWLDKKKPDDAEKLRNQDPEVAFLTVGGEADDYDIMITVLLSRSFLWFGTSYSFNLKYRNLEIVEIEAYG